MGSLRQQILVLQRGVKGARLEDTDRMPWIMLRRFVRGWRDMLYSVQPETVIRWHREVSVSEPRGRPSRAA